MVLVTDEEFGDIIIRSNSRARGMSLSIRPNGRIQISAPRLMPQFMIKRFINQSRDEIRSFKQRHAHTSYTDGMSIGKSHRLEVRQGDRFAVRTHANLVVVTLRDQSIDSPQVQAQIRSHVQKIIRREATSYLPKRLETLAQMHDCTYTKVRLSHASTRWGSCSSSGTISLNISLMMLPYELIDYVIVHELAHTKHMNHSKEFWEEVASMDDQHVQHRKQVKQYSTSL